MATKIRGLQIVDSIAGAALDLTSSGILNVLVDGITVSTDGNQLSVIASGVDHNSLLNTHNLTTDTDHDQLTNTHNLSTDIDHDGLTNTHNLTTDIDHGSISGLDGDDHTQYILVDGTRAFTGVFEAVGMELTEGDVKLFSAPADGDVSGITASGTTSATFSQAVYLNGSGEYVAAKADAESTMPAVALSTGAGNEVITHGYITEEDWDWTPGGLIYVSDGTAGALTQTAPTASGSQVQVVGVAVSADTIFFNPDLTFMELGDPPYYTKLELTASGVLDVRYYTEDEIDSMLTTSSGDILQYVSDNYIDNTEMATISGDIMQEVSDNYISNSEMTTISGDILTYVSANYIDNTEMTTISGDIISYLTSTSGVIDHGNLAGLGDDDHGQYLLVTVGTRTLLADLLPNASGTIDLGSAAAPFAEIHTDDIYVKGASIHLGGYEISEFSNDDTLADDSYSTLPTEYAVKHYVDTISGSLEDGIIWEVVDTPTNRIQPKAAHMSLPVFIADDLTVGGNLTVTGTIFYTQTEQVLISDNFMYLNYGETASGVSAVTAGIDIDRGGFPDYVFAFDERNDTFRIGVSGSQDAFNDYPLQPVATREDSPTDTRVPWWDAASYTFRTQGDCCITVNSGTDEIAVTISGVNKAVFSPAYAALYAGPNIFDYLIVNDGSIDIGLNKTSLLNITETTQRIGKSGETYFTMSQSDDSITAGVQGIGSVLTMSSGGTYRFGKYSQFDINNPAGTMTFTPATGAGYQLTISGTAGIKLYNSTAYVNEILNTTDADFISASSTDAQLATAKLIYDYVNTISGTMVHNELEGLQGGLSGAYYHLGATAFTALSGVDGTDVSNWDTAYSHTLSTSNPHSVTYTQVGAIQDSTDTVKDTHIDWGTGANQVDLDDVPDGATYERVLGTQLESGIYINATTAVKGIASFSSDNFAVTSGAVTVKDDGIAEPELVIANAPIDGYYLQYTTASGMKWTDVSTEGVLESDFQLNNLSAECDGVETQFYLSYIPVANSLQVYLNGLLQEKGGGKDYTNTTSGVLFTTAPLTGDILIAHYVRQSA